MSQHRRIAVACALAGVAVLSAGALTATAQGKKGSKKPAAGAASSKALVAAGKEIYTANGCGACHKIAGKGGATGPELTHIGKTVKAAQITSVIRKGGKAKSGASMPAYGGDKINDKDLKALVAYLGSLK